MSAEHKSYLADKAGYFKVVSSDIVRPLEGDQEGWEVVIDSPELAQKRQENRSRIEHNVFTYTGHEHVSGWSDVIFGRPGGTRGKEPTKKPRGYSDEYWQGKKWTSNDMTIKKR